MDPLEENKVKNKTDLYEVIHRHRSIRKYKDRPVPEKILTRILGAALRASSSGNMQTYSIIVTEDEKLKKQLYEHHFKQSMVVDAPLLITFCADFHRMRKWVKLSDAPDNFDNFMSFMIAAIDATLASQNAALAAETEGLGICYMGTTLANCQKIGELLNCPKNVVPVVGFSLGYPAEVPKVRDRLPLKGIVHRDTYKNIGDKEIRSIYHERETAGWKRYNEIPELREMVEKAGVKNLAQIYTQLKYTRESHIDYSKTVLDYLRQQDFMSLD